MEFPTQSPTLPKGGTIAEAGKQEFGDKWHCLIIVVLMYTLVAVP